MTTGPVDCFVFRSDSPLSFPPVLAGGMGPGDDTTALYVGGGGGGGVERA